MKKVVYTAFVRNFGKPAHDTSYESLDQIREVWGDQRCFEIRINRRRAIMVLKHTEILIYWLSRNPEDFPKLIRRK